MLSQYGTCTAEAFLGYPSGLPDSELETLVMICYPTGFLPEEEGKEGRVITCN